MGDLRRFLAGSCCTAVHLKVRPIWALEELGVPYTVVPVNFSAEYRQTPEWRKMNPVGKVPAMTDGDLTMFESVAMMQYILDRYGAGRLQPTAGTSCVPSFVPECCLRMDISGVFKKACDATVIMLSTCSGATLLKRLLLDHLAKWSTTAESLILRRTMCSQRWRVEGNYASRHSTKCLQMGGAISSVTSSAVQILHLVNRVACCHDISRS